MPEKKTSTNPLEKVWGYLEKAPLWFKVTVAGAITIGTVLLTVQGTRSDVDALQRQVPKLTSRVNQNQDALDRQGRIISRQRDLIRDLRQSTKDLRAVTDDILEAIGDAVRGK